MTSRALVALLSFVGCLMFASGARAAVVMNEIDYDQPGTDSGEFIELLNNGASAVSLNGYTIRLVNVPTTPSIKPSPSRLVSRSARASIT